MWYNLKLKFWDTYILENKGKINVYTYIYIYKYIKVKIFLQLDKLVLFTFWLIFTGKCFWISWQNWNSESPSN